MKFALIALIAAVSAVNVRYTYEDIREFFGFLFLENKNSNAKPTETESGNTTPPPTPGPAHSNPTTEELSSIIYDKLYKSLIWVRYIKLLKNTISRHEVISIVDIPHPNSYLRFLTVKTTSFFFYFSLLHFFKNNI